MPPPHQDLLFAAGADVNAESRDVGSVHVKVELDASLRLLGARYERRDESGSGSLGSINVEIGTCGAQAIVLQKFVYFTLCHALSCRGLQ